MPTFIDNIYGMVAQCNFDADAAAAAFRTQRGFLAAFTRNGAGDYSLTFDSAQDVANLVITNGLLGAAPGMIAVELVSSTVIRVRTLSSAAMAADIDFTLQVAKNGPN